MTYIISIVPCLVCLFWTVTYLLNRRINNPAQRFLTLFLAVSSILYACHWIFFNCTSGIVRISDCIYAFCNIAVFPLYYLYVKRLTHIGPLKRRDWAVLLPALLIGIWATVNILNCPTSMQSERLRVSIAKIVFAIQLLPVFVYSFRYLREFQRTIGNYYSNTSRRNVRPTQWMVWVLLIGVSISLAFSLLGREHFKDAGTIIALPSILFTFLLYAVGYEGTRQRFCADEMQEEHDADSEHLTSHDPNGADESAYEQMLSNLMQEEQLYLQPDLRLSDIALRLGVGRTTLSQVINQKMGTSFSDFVNRFRIEYAKTLMTDAEPGQEMSLNWISEKSGFQSESTFYRAFRQYTGRTPRQWLAEKAKK